MFENIFNVTLYFYGYCIFFFSLALMATYVMLVVFANKYSSKYRRWTDDYIKRMVDSSPYVPAVTIVAGAKGEADVIEKSVKSMLALDYPNFEICIVRNSKNDEEEKTLKYLEEREINPDATKPEGIDLTLDTLIKKFSLVKIPCEYVEEIHVAPFRALYKSTDKKYSRLTVIDKESGGTKADAINGGLNVIKTPYIINTDVDCILSKEAIYQCIFPILQDESIIAVSGTMSINNGFDIGQDKEGKIVINEKAAPGFFFNKKKSTADKSKDKRSPLKRLWDEHHWDMFKAMLFILVTVSLIYYNMPLGVMLAAWLLMLIIFFLPVALIQDLEYKRSFLVGKMGWSHINAMNNVSGGYGLFNTEVVKAAGGYGKDSFAEDMDMLTRMVAYCCETGRDYKVVQIPHTCCWTQATIDIQNLYKQRKRWGLGLFQVMWEHRHMIGNRRYKRMGMITFMNTLFFEFLAPIIEFVGYFIMIWLYCNDKINWDTFWWVLGSVYVFSILLNQFVLAFDYILGGSYTHSYRNYVKLTAASLLEPIYHFFVVISSLKGYFNYLKNKLTGTVAVWENIKRIQS